MIGIVCGTRREAAILTGLGRTQLVSIAISAALPDWAEARARDLIAAGVTCLISAGVAGGLDPSLVPGDVVVGTTAISQDRSLPLAAFRPSPELDGLKLHFGPVLGLDQPAMDVALKRDLYQTTGAIAVDMETHRVAHVAAQAGLPVLALRTIADPAARAVPQSALAGIDAQGKEVFWPVISRLLSRPLDLPPLLRLAGDYRAALKSLEAFVDRAPDLESMIV